MPARPLIGIVGGFTRQKGFDLIAQIAGELAKEDLALVALGTGEPEYEELFLDLAASFPAGSRSGVAYDNVLAHKIERVRPVPDAEPLRALRPEPDLSMRYGTLPLVRATGGLEDTVEESTGFKFWE